MSRATRDRRRVRLGDVVTWGHGERSYRVERVDGPAALLDVTADAGSRFFVGVSYEPDGRRLLRVSLARLRVTWRPGAKARTNARRLQGAAVMARR